MLAMDCVTLRLALRPSHLSLFFCRLLPKARAAVGSSLATYIGVLTTPAFGIWYLAGLLRAAPQMPHPSGLRRDPATIVEDLAHLWIGDVVEPRHTLPILQIYNCTFYISIFWYLPHGFSSPASTTFTLCAIWTSPFVSLTACPLLQS